MCAISPQSYLRAVRFRHFPPEEQTAGGVFNSHKSQLDVLNYTQLKEDPTGMSEVL